jgi:ribulose-phosphate 3-epimerase
MKRPIKIAPSILSADFRCLEREVKQAEDAGADCIHCDVMDGVFVPNITFGSLVVEAVRKCVSIPLDVHLMITNPAKHVDAFCRAGASTLTFHAEECTDIPAALAAIKTHHVRAGVTVNPDKPVDLLLPYLSDIDQVLVMTVYAGLGGQKFIPEMLAKVRAVDAEAKRLGREIDIEVDGGINPDTAADCARAGANVFVAGNYIFTAANYGERIQALRQGAREGQSQRR